MFNGILRGMKHALLALILAIPALAFAQSEPLLLTAQEWAHPRNGQVLVGYPSLQAAVSQLMGDETASLELRYPGGDEGSLWVQELRAWLVALGVASARIEAVPGSGTDAAIELQVISREAAVGRPAEPFVE